MISLHKFYEDSVGRAVNTGERHGQAMFNHLCEVRLDLANMVRATNKDPFYAHRGEPNWDRFVKFIESHWYQETLACLECGGSGPHTGTVGHSFK